MKISIVTLFPEMFQGVFEHSILKHAQEKNLLTISFVNIRYFGIGKHNLVDDTPYGGGAGMVMRVDVIASALANSKLKTQNSKLRERIILLDPQGKKLTQKKAQELATVDHIILVCGRYEGVDERVRDLVDEEISIGDYVLTGGEIPAMVVVDSVVRLIPGVINSESTQNESFSSVIARNPAEADDEAIFQKEDRHGRQDQGDLAMTRGELLEYPQYTRPAIYKDKPVPDILLSGDHKKIAAWRKKEAIAKTKKQRPDLIAQTKTVA